MAFINTITDGIASTCKNVFSKYAGAFTSAAPLSSVFSALREIRNYLLSRNEKVQALLAGLSCVEGIFNSAVQNAADPTGLDLEVEITTEDVNYLLSGFRSYQIRELLDPENQKDLPANKFFQFTSLTGQVYTFRINYDALDDESDGPIISCVNQYDESFDSTLVYRENGKAMLKNLIRPINYLPINNYHEATYQDVYTDLFRVLGVDMSNPLPDSSLGTLSTMLCITLFGMAGGNYSLNQTMLNRALHTDEIDDPLEQVIAWFVPSMTFKQVAVATTAAEPFIYGVKSLFEADAINEWLLEMTDSLLSGKVEPFLDRVDARYEQKYESIKSLKDRIKSSYAKNGVMGVISDFFNLVKAPTTTTTANGVLEFTDNAGLAPQQYIAGAIGVGLEFISTIATVIAEMLSNVVAWIVAGLAVVGKTILQIVQAPYDDTRAILLNPSLDDYPGYLSASPIAGVQYSSNVVPDWYQSFFNLGYPLLAINVPGGVLLVGPGAYDTDESGLEVVSELRFEFHPYLLDVKIDDGEFAAAIGEVITSLQVPDVGEVHRVDYLKVVAKGTTYFEDLWNDMINGYPHIVISNNPDNGHLDDDDDKLVRRLTAVCYWIFWCWCLCRTWQILPSVPSDARILYSSDIHLDRIDSVISDTWYAFYHYGATPWVMTWSELIEDITYLSQDRDVVPMISMSYYNTQYNTGSYSIQNGLQADWIDSNLVLATTSDDFCPPVAITHDIMWAYNVPKYDSATFFLWTAVAAIGMIAITVGTIIAVVKIRDAIRAKRASLNMTVDSARTDYSNAVNGIEEYIDDQGVVRTRTFDTTTAEGKAKIQAAWKNYKSAAFKGNLWANLIGGSKFDTTSFWGDKEEDSSDTTEDVEEKGAGIIETVKTKVLSMFRSPSDDSTATQVDDISLVEDISLNSIYYLIKGYPTV